MKKDTEESRAAYNAYMREFRQRPEQKEKDRKSHKARREYLLLADPVGRRRKEIISSRRRRWVNLLSSEEYDKRLSERKGVCALCGTPFDNTKLGGAALDHCHETDQIREFVHNRCNLGIANFLENPAVCRLAAEYLERHKREGL